ncbi:MAG: formate dehydrogenase accessory sulfurtransferase FdhD [Phycisphaerales bacterium]|nr:formate dehydrogenase accessory sulfurtransferase FdhD [Phycisphaerales bacterium]
MQELRLDSQSTTGSNVEASVCSAAVPGESITRTAIIRVELGAECIAEDSVAVEEPLEIRLSYCDDSMRRERSLSITMRTPGADEDLAIGFLLSEGIVHARDEIEGVDHPHSTRARENIIIARLAEHAKVNWPTMERHFYATSSCGVCGKSSLDALESPGLAAIANDGATTTAAIICSLPATMRTHQATFQSTGGLHGAALFQYDGSLIDLREDVGRHNAVDKLIGSQFMAGGVPLCGRILVLSGRASFELVQKAVMAGVGMIVAVGAPSSLAIELAQRFNVTLVGFVRGERFNIYCGRHRIRA